MRTRLSEGLPEEAQVWRNRLKVGTVWRAIMAAGLVLSLSLVFGFALSMTSQGRDIALVTVSPGELFPLISFTVFLIALGVNNYASALLLVASSPDKILERNLSLPLVEFTAKLLAFLPSVFAALVYLSQFSFEALSSNEPVPQPIKGFAASLIAGAAVYFLTELVETRTLRRHVSAHSRYFIVDRQFRTWYRITAAVLIVIITIVLLGVPTLQRAFGAGAVLLLALNAYLIVFTAASQALRRRSIPLVPVIIVLIAVMSLLGSDTHHVRSLALTEGRPTAQVHAERWLDAAQTRAETVGSDADIPVVIVLAEGGGIRAAQFSSQFLHALDSAQSGAFFEDVYVLSGVSGGSVGVATFLASQYESDRERAGEALRSFYATDHFSPLLSALLMLDIPTRFAPLELIRSPLAQVYDRNDAANLPDRSDTFERSFEEAWCRAIGASAQRGGACTGEDGQRSPNPMAMPLESLALTPNLDVAPFVLFSSVRANDGELGVVSNASLFNLGPSGLQSITIQDQLAIQSGETARTLPASAAAHVSARFPFVNPPAVVDAPGPNGHQRLRYVDGAYMDNSGALAAQIALHALLEVAEERSIADRLRIEVVHIYARDIVDAFDDSGPTRDLFAQTMTPVQAVAMARNNIGLSPIRGLCALLLDQPYRAGDCQYLDELRIATPEGSGVPSELQVGSRAVVTAFRDFLDGQSAASEVYWVSVPLDASIDPASPQYAPLGWLLNPTSRTYVEQEAMALGRYVSDVRLAFVERD